jgi:hypothetical protein
MWRTSRPTTSPPADEYGTGFLFKPKQSTQPLSFGELIMLIDSATGHLEWRAGAHERLPRLQP